MKIGKSYNSDQYDVEFPNIDKFRTSKEDSYLSLSHARQTRLWKPNYTYHNKRRTTRANNPKYFPDQKSDLRGGKKKPAGRYCSSRCCRNFRGRSTARPPGTGRRELSPVWSPQHPWPRAKGNLSNPNRRLRSNQILYTFRFSYATRMPPAILFHRPVACLRLRPFHDFSAYELLGLCLGGEKIWTRRGFRWRRSGRERETKKKEKERKTEGEKFNE